MGKKEQQDIADAVQLHANSLAVYMFENQVPMHIGMAALSMALATAAKTNGFSRHDVISHFAASVNLIYKDLDDGRNT